MPNNNLVAAKLNKLKKELKKDILILNNELPADLGKLWVNCKELHGRLVHAGVDQYLDLDMVHDAIKRVNTGQKYLAARKFEGIRYFRSILCHLDDDNAEAVLSVQRFTRKLNGVKKRINLNTSKDYFKSSGSACLVRVNEAITAI